MTNRLRHLIDEMYAESHSKSVIISNILNAVETLNFQNTVLESKVEKYFMDLLIYVKTDDLGYMIELINRLPVIIIAEQLFIDNIICRDLLEKIKLSRYRNDDIRLYLNFLNKTKELSTIDKFLVIKKQFKKNAYEIFNLFNKEFYELTIACKVNDNINFFNIFLKSLQKHKIQDVSLGTIRQITEVITHTYFHVDTELNDYILPILENKGLLGTYYLCDIYRNYDIYDFVSKDMIDIFSGENSKQIHDTLIDIKNKVITITDGSMYGLEVFGKDFFKQVLDIEHGEIKGTDEILRFISNEMLKKVDKKIITLKKNQQKINNGLHIR